MWLCQWKIVVIAMWQFVKMIDLSFVYHIPHTRLDFILVPHTRLDFILGLQIMTKPLFIVVSQITIWNRYSLWFHGSQNLRTVWPLTLSPYRRNRYSFWCQGSQFETSSATGFVTSPSMYTPTRNLNLNTEGAWPSRAYLPFTYTPTRTL